MEPEDQQKYLRSLPAVDELLRHPQLQPHIEKQSRELVADSIRRVLAARRQAILTNADELDGAGLQNRSDDLPAAVLEELAAANRPSLRPVINATGVVLHTNLGRAPLSPAALRDIIAVAKGYSNLEFDLEKGERGARISHVEEILCRVSGAESALVVNNNAAAVLLALNTLAQGKEVVVSRGQLVEIGGSFRIPDVMSRSGARLVEVGTTNRTHLSDYERAIGQETALLLKVHTSNFRILGFTAEVPLKDLAALGRSRGLPVMEDLGSGCFVDLSPFGIEKEPTVQEAVAAGADLVTFSGDKMLGGPQAGVVLGRKAHIDRLKRNPLTRALRIDKMTLAGLDATLREYLRHDLAFANIPALRMLTTPAAELQRRAKRLRRRLSREYSGLCATEVKEESSQVGGGALPLQALPTFVIALRPLKISAAALEEGLRKKDPPVITRIKEGEVLLDLRTVAVAEENALLRALGKVLQTEEESSKRRA